MDFSQLILQLQRLVEGFLYQNDSHVVVAIFHPKLCLDIQADSYNAMRRFFATEVLHFLRKHLTNLPTNRVQFRSLLFSP